MACRWWMASSVAGGESMFATICALLLLSYPLGKETSLATPSSAEVCGSCHRAIFEGWKKSAHAAAMESRLFQDALELAEAEFGSSTRRVCLNCHSPVSVQTDDLALVKKVSWEGVTCDYCHSMQQVNTSGGNPKATVAFTLVKSGPSKDLFSPAHGTAFSSLLTSSTVCMPCHEYRNAQGFAVLTTFSEWKSGPYGKSDEDCQSCHMYSVQGEVVDPRVKRSSMAKINLHEIPGSRSTQQLNKAVKMDLATEREGDRVKVMVKLTNRGAGHDVPTGSPLRQLLLEVRVDSYDGKHFRQEAAFRRTVADQRGKILDREPAVFTQGARAVEDTRLTPHETRTATFSFPVPRGTQAQVEADLLYYYSPMARTEEQQKFKFVSASRLVQ